MPANLENSAVATGLEKVSFHSNLKSRAMPKNVQSIAQLYSSHASRVMPKILQARLQQYMNHEFSDVQAEFRKGRGTRIKLTASIRSLKKQGSSRKTSTSALLTMPKPLTIWITTNCGKFWKRWEYQTTLPASWEICTQVKEQKLEPTWNNRLVPNWERSTSRLYIVTLLI